MNFVIVTQKGQFTHHEEQHSPGKLLDCMMSSAALDGKIMPTGLKQTKPLGLNYANVRHVDAV